MKKFAIQVVYYALIWLPFQLTWHAILGWSDDQLAGWLGIKSPSVSHVYRAMVEFGPSLLLAGLAFYLYHLWWSRQADTSGVRDAQAKSQERREEIELQAPASKVPSGYLTAYETIHYLADESQWGAERDSYVSSDGLKRNALIDAPAEFRARAAEGRIGVYGASSHTGQHELIPKIYWMSYGLDLSKIYHPDAASSTAPATFEAGFHGVRIGKHTYSDLKIEAADVYSVWPRRKDVDAEFDAAFEWAALSREEAIKLLWRLRKVGVAIRNEPVPSEQLFPPWKAKYERWRHDVLLAAEKVDENLRHRLEVLDRLRPPPTLPVINRDHALCITITSEILLRLEERLP